MAKKQKKKHYYHSKEFRKLQAEWYEKIKQDGFNDIEWFNSDTGFGQNSPFLNPSMGSLRRRLSSSTSQHFRICRNFLQHGPFYPNLLENFIKINSLEDFILQEYLISDSKFFPRYSSQPLEASEAFKDYLQQYPDYLDSLDYMVFNAYTEGVKLLDTSNELRRLHSLNQVPKARKPIELRKSGEPYSIFWVTKRIEYIKKECALFNWTDPEGLGSEEELNWEDFVIDLIDSEGELA